MTYIGDYLFRGCSSLISINIPNNVTIIGSYAFYGCSSLTSIYIPNNVIRIGGWAFDECNLTFVVISNYIKYFETHAFSYCKHVYCFAKEVPNVREDGLQGETLHVPLESYDSYNFAFKNKFEYIVPITEDEMAGIESPILYKFKSGSDAVYNLNGQYSPSSTPTQGVNIIRKSDGRVKKVYVK